MSKVTRSDYAATSDWNGILGKPANLGGTTDISQITGNGYAVGQVPRWNGTRFVPYTIPSSSTPVTPPVSPLEPQEQFTWNVPTLNPLQSAYSDMPYIGVVPGDCVAWGVSVDLQFCWPNAAIIQNDTIRLMMLNLNSVPVTLGDVVFNIQVFP